LKKTASAFWRGTKKGGEKVLSFFHWLDGKKGWRSFASGVICVLIGLLAGFILMICLDPKNCGEGLVTLLTQGASDSSSIDRVIYKAIPMILSGLSIAFSFKLGLFNIGITSQVTIGAFVALLLGIYGFDWYVCLVAAMMAGAAVGFVIGFLKARFNVNEVLSGIMLNWIIYYMIGLIGTLYLPGSYKNKTAPSFLKYMPAAGRLPSLGISGMMGITVGLLIALFIVIALQILLDRTVFGFELKLSGTNKFAAQYAGISQTAKIILALIISGAVAGICGYMLYANPESPLQFRWDSGDKTLLADGFNGISVSLIAQNSPVGCIFSSLLLTYIDSAQTSLKSVSDYYNIHYTELIKAIIIYVASFSSFINLLIQKWHGSHEEMSSFLALTPQRNENLKQPSQGSQKEAK
jgi:simple sugar transport system permease protein